jgi:hypothetical protein
MCTALSGSVFVVNSKFVQYEVGIDFYVQDEWISIFIQTFHQTQPFQLYQNVFMMQTSK